MQRKHTAGGFQIKDAVRGEAEAIFATFNTIDHDGDVTVPGAIPDGSEVIISQWGHNAVLSGTLPVGRGVVRTTAKDARVEAKFFLDTTHGREAFEVVRQLGPLTQWSYGYKILDSERGEFHGRRVQFLKSLELFEVSPVARGAGIGTRTVDAKDELAQIHVRMLAEQFHADEIRRIHMAVLAGGLS